mgnify:FL=1
MLSEKKFRLPKEIPLEEYPKPEVFLEEARRLIGEAQKQGMILRVMGPIAIHYYFPDYIDLYYRLERLGERVFTDIDFASYGKFRDRMIAFFQSQSYEIEKRALLLLGKERHIYFGDRVPMVDVFYDRLAYNHPIEFRGRLELHPECISMTDLLLQKLQIVQINDKDMKDAMLLLLAARLGETDQDGINARYIAKLMAEDWGFYYTTTTNLDKIKAGLEDISVLTEANRKIIKDKIDALKEYIENMPKTAKWKLRAKVGTRVSWYNEVSDWG